MDDDAQIYSVLARMREPMLKAHPEWLPRCISDVLECVLCLEEFQGYMLAENARLRTELEDMTTYAESHKNSYDRYKARCFRAEAECDHYREVLKDIADMDGKGADLGLWRAIAETVLKK